MEEPESLLTDPQHDGKMSSRRRSRFKMHVPRTPQIPCRSHHGSDRALEVAQRFSSRDAVRRGTSAILGSTWPISETTPEAAKLARARIRNWPPCMGNNWRWPSQSATPELVAYLLCRPTLPGSDSKEKSAMKTKTRKRASMTKAARQRYHRSTGRPVLAFALFPQMDVWPRASVVFKDRTDRYAHVYPSGEHLPPSRNLRFPLTGTYHGCP